MGRINAHFVSGVRKFLELDINYCNEYILKNYGLCHFILYLIDNIKLFVNTLSFHNNTLQKMIQKTKQNIIKTKYP